MSKVAFWRWRKGKHVFKDGRSSSKKTAVNSEKGIVCLEDKVPIVEPNTVPFKLMKVDRRDDVCVLWRNVHCCSKETRQRRRMNVSKWV